LLFSANIFGDERGSYRKLVNISLIKS